MPISSKQSPEIGYKRREYSVSLRSALRPAGFDSVSDFTAHFRSQEVRRPGVTRVDASVTSDGKRPQEVRRPGIEPGLVAWEATVLPLDQRRVDSLTRIRSGPEYKWFGVGDAADPEPAVTPSDPRLRAVRTRQAGGTVPRSRRRRVRTRALRTPGGAARSHAPAVGTARRLRARTPASPPPASPGRRAS